MAIDCSLFPSVQELGDLIHSQRKPAPKQILQGDSSSSKSTHYQLDSMPHKWLMQKPYIWIQGEMGSWN